MIVVFPDHTHLLLVFLSGEMEHLEINKSVLM